MNARRPAKRILEVIPPLMHYIRQNMGEVVKRDLSVPQFRALAYLNRHAGGRVSDLAQRQGVSRPAMSRTVESLVKRGCVERLGHGRDRRQTLLGLSARGRRIFLRARVKVEARLAGLLAGFPAGRMAGLMESLDLLEALMERKKNT